MQKKYKANLYFFIWFNHDQQNIELLCNKSCNKILSSDLQYSEYDMKV